MKFYAATTKTSLLLTGIFIDNNRTFSPGTEVTAVEAGEDRWHLNAECDGETYDGYARSRHLDLGEVVATCNEGK